jgi:hypothetical protein
MIIVSILVGDIMIRQEQTMILSPYMKIYDIVIPKDNILRRIMNE